MNSSELRSRHEEAERSAAPTQGAYSNNLSHLGSGHEAPDNGRPEFTLLVAGNRGGKTSFLRLLLDTSEIHPNASKEQLTSVAKFVQGCSGHTSNIRAASIDISLDVESNNAKQCLGLSLIDTPSLDFKDEAAAERLLSETLRHIDARFAEGVEEEWRALRGDRYVHLCIYFLDPDQIVPPSVPGPPAPLVPRTRTGSFTQPDQEPVILEPPVTTNPLLFRPTLPPADINAIRKLSSRVNVLPVISRADILSNDRLAAVKVAIRRDLAEAGIGFGIFDMDGQYLHMQDDHSAPGQTDSSNGYNNHPNGSSSNANSPPTSPVTPSLLRLPYALISPDLYSHSDGVPRIPLSRHELVHQYTPGPIYPQSTKLSRGKFLRSYRWGCLDVLDSAHSDFLPLRAAIFHHMETLQKYTREYLFDKFRAEYIQQRQPSIPLHAHLGSMSVSRPILAINTAPHTSVQRHSTLSGIHEILSGDSRSAPLSRPPQESASVSGKSSAGPRQIKARPKKITVACNFCRSRKLKCDGGRPACSQCLKRSNACDYMPQNKRRGMRQRNKGEDSESESGGEKSPDVEDPSTTPDTSSQYPQRRGSNVDKISHDGFPPTLPSMAAIIERREEGPIPSSSRSKPLQTNDSRSFFPGEDLPHIATLSLPEPSPSTPVPMSAPSLPPIRPASEQQAAQRKRASTVPGKSSRQTSSSGPKVVACNFCRARKTKCDGAHPACASCARRQLPCNYVHDSSSNAPAQKKSRRPSTSKPSADSPDSVSPPSSRAVPTPSTGSQDRRDIETPLEGDMDLKRPLEHSDIGRASKKLRMEHSPAIAGIP